VTPAPTIAPLKSKRLPLPLRWRVAWLAAALLALVALVVAGTVLVVVKAALEASPREFLHSAAAQAKALFASSAVGSVAVDNQPSGDFKVALFNSDGTPLILGSVPIPLAVVQAAAQTQEQETIWSGSAEGEPWQALLVPTEISIGPKQKQDGVLAVFISTGYIQKTLQTVVIAVLIVTAICVLVALVAGYSVASLGLRPLMVVAEQAKALDETNLQLLQYHGANDELGQLTETLNNLVLRLRAAFAAQKIFLAETSHELRTPLTGLTGYLRRASREASDSQRPALDDALRVSENMARLVADLLQLSRGDVVAEWLPHIIDLGEIAGNVAREFGVAFEADGRAGPLEMVGDPDRLAQLVRNLVSNAVRAAGAEAVRVCCVREGQCLLLRIDDAGPGIPPDILPHIFKKFYRGPGGGTGLGLAIAEQIVRVHTGSISVESERGNGAHFRVSFPVLDDDDE
jgi:two-component system, OmpR family, sensor kinase